MYVNVTLLLTCCHVPSFLASTFLRDPFEIKHNHNILFIILQIRFPPLKVVKGATQNQINLRIEDDKEDFSEKKY